MTSRLSRQPWRLISGLGRPSRHPLARRATAVLSPLDVPSLISHSTSVLLNGHIRGYVAPRRAGGGGRFLGHGRSHLPDRRAPAAAGAHEDGEALPHSGATETPRQDAAESSQETGQLHPVDPAVYTEAVIPREPRDVLQPDDPDFEGAHRLLAQSALIVTRELEMMNIFLGYEQANRYSVLSPTGEQVGYLTEEETGLLGGALKRQLLRTHRPFRATVMNAEGRPVLMIKRGITYINSTTLVYAVRHGYPIGSGPPKDEDLLLIGEVQQRWHIYRRRYELFLRRAAEEEDGDHYFEQFAQIDAGLWSWNFLLQDSDDKLVGAIDRNFRGFGRELFADVGQYVVRFDSVGQTDMTDPRIAAPTTGQPADASGQESSGTALVESHGSRPLTLDERAVALATAVSIDFDYFSRHSSHASGSGMFPWFFMGGGGGGSGEVGETAPPPPPPPPPPPTQGPDGGGFGPGAMGGSMGQTDHPYGPSDSGNSDGFPRQSQDYPPPSEQQQQQQEGGGDTWGTGSSDPWAGADDTEIGGGDGGGGGLFGNWTDWLPGDND